MRTVHGTHAAGKRHKAVHAYIYIFMHTWHSAFCVQNASKTALLPAEYAAAGCPRGWFKLPNRGWKPILGLIPMMLHTMQHMTEF